MATPSPFSWLKDALAQWSSQVAPPAWLVEGAQHRLVLFVNHVLMQEPEAQARLARHKGQTLLVQWRQFQMALAATPAGLLERQTIAPARPDLRLTVTDESPLDLAGAALRGNKPAVHIEGDVQLAAEVNWLVDNLRWDVEEDLARVIGDAPAHTLAQTARKITTALRQFVGRRGADSGSP